MNRVVVMASRLVERRRKNERDTSEDADLPISVVALSKYDVDGNEGVFMMDSSSAEFPSLLLLLLDDEARVILLISCFSCCKLFRLRQ